MKTIRIHDKDERRILPFDLIDILIECGDYADRRWLAWAVLWGARYGYPDNELELLDSTCYEGLDEAPNRQLEMTFDQLMKCAKSVNQTESGFFLAVRPTVETVPDLYSLRGCEKAADIIIHAFYFAFWEVTTENEELLEKLRAKFRNTEIYDIMMAGGSDIPR